MTAHTVARHTRRAHAVALVKSCNGKLIPALLPLTRCVGLLLASLLLFSCASFKPVPIEQFAFTEEAQKQQKDNILVKVAVPSAEDANAIYGVDLHSKQIQAVWIEVNNGSKEPLWLLPTGLDPEYFSAAEAAFAYHIGSNDAANAVIDRHFDDLQFQGAVPPGGRRSGFVLTNLDDGVKVVDVDLLSNAAVYSLTYFVEVPGFQADYHQVDVNTLYQAPQVQQLQDKSALRAYLESLPCCAANEKGEPEGDPINIVLVGDREDIFAALLRRKWHATERLWSKSMTRTISSFLSGSRYRYSPVSPLYLYDRKQDVSLQKTRGSIHERNHMRLWLSPVSFRGKEVWAGQISRDIGVKLTFKSPTITTHIIDPDVDDARGALMEDLVYSQNVSAFGAVYGVRESTVTEPRTNLVGDPYYTDGLRAVVFIEPRSHSMETIGVVTDWIVPQRGVMGYRQEYLESETYLGAVAAIDNLLRPRAQRQSSAGITVSATLASPDESKVILGIDPLKKGVQALWVEVTNNTNAQFGLMQTGIDPDYFSPLELAHAFHKPFSGERNEQLDEHIQSMDLADPILPGTTVSGFVFINASPSGGQIVDVDLVGKQSAESFTFVLSVPNREYATDGQGSKLHTIYSADELYYIEDESELRQQLLHLPCCSSLAEDYLDAEPLNLVLIGNLDEIRTGFGRRDYIGTSLEDRYVFGRKPDFAAIKRAQWVASHSHTMRVWLTPLVYRGQAVWLAQTSNRKGGRFAHGANAGEGNNLEPYIDQSRRDLSQDLAFSQAVKKHWLIGGAGRKFATSSDSPNTALDYITDGKRSVLFFQSELVPLDQMQLTFGD